MSPVRCQWELLSLRLRQKLPGWKRTFNEGKNFKPTTILMFTLPELVSFAAVIPSGCPTVSVVSPLRSKQSFLLYFPSPSSLPFSSGLKSITEDQGLKLTVKTINTVYVHTLCVTFHTLRVCVCVFVVRLGLSLTPNILTRSPN